MVNRFKILFVLALVAFQLSAGLQLAYAQEMDHVHVSIDIRPGSYPNPINLKSKGTVPVALLGSADFDVATADTSSVKFGRMHEFESGASPVSFSLKDVNLDGYMDILFHFKIQKTGLLPTDTEACLHGMLSSGEHFCGHDSIKIVS